MSQPWAPQTQQEYTAGWDLLESARLLPMDLFHEARQLRDHAARVADRAGHGRVRELAGLAVVRCGAFLVRWEPRRQTAEAASREDFRRVEEVAEQIVSELQPFYYGQDASG